MRVFAVEQKAVGVMDAGVFQHETVAQLVRHTARRGRGLPRGRAGGVVVAAVERGVRRRILRARALVRARVAIAVAIASATAREAEWAKRLLLPTTNVSNV